MSVPDTDSNPDEDFHFCRPALPRIKSCLKSSPAHSGTSTPSSDGSVSFPNAKKHVVFSDEGTEQVYEADEWDRTPAEITQRLSYEDVLELKMLQRELPRAAQPVDAFSSKPFANVFLAHVPIPLLPLNPTTHSCFSASPSSLSPSATPLNMTSPPPSPSPPEVTTIPTRDFRPPLPSQDTHVIRPHNIPVPPPPVPPRRTYPPAPSSQSQKLTNVKSNLNPKRTFSFIPLLDDSSHGNNAVSRTPTPTPSPSTTATTTPAGSASPVVGSVPPPDTPNTALSSSTPLASHLSSLSDPDRSDQGYISDCSVTEASTPSLTTASLASSSPPDSPGLEHDMFYEHNERGGRIRQTSRSGTDGDELNVERFMLNLDMDADVDTLDSYFPRVPHSNPPPSLTMQPMDPAKADSQKNVSTGTGAASHTFVSRVPISPFHARHPHLNRPTFATPSAKSALSVPPSGQGTNASNRNRNTSDGQDSHSISTTLSSFDPLNKLRLHAVPSPDLDVPSSLELPPRSTTTASARSNVRSQIPGNIKSVGSGGNVAPRKIRMGLVPLAEPVACHQPSDQRGLLLGANEGVIPPSLSRS
ncbi:hypothetical protein V8B97DRAFT_1752822 [Scleroderma yunnanense]